MQQETPFLLMIAQVLPCDYPSQASEMASDDNINASVTNFAAATPARTTETLTQLLLLCLTLLLLSAVE